MPITPTNPFKGRQYPGEVILLAVRWYLRYPRTLQGIEAMHMINKGRVRWLAKGDAVGQAHFVASLFGIAA